MLALTEAPWADLAAGWVLISIPAALLAAQWLHRRNRR